MAHKSISREIELAAGQNIKQLEYWKHKLAGDPVKSNFPHDYKEKAAVKEAAKSDRGSMSFRLAGEAYEKLVRLSKGSIHTQHIVLLAALTGLLSRYTGSGDVSIGAPIYRQETEAELINTMLVVRSLVYPDMTFKELLVEVKQTVLEAVSNQAYPLELLPARLGMPLPDAGFAEDFPLFDVALLVEEIHDREYLGSLKPGMVFVFNMSETGAAGEVEYCSSKYSEIGVGQVVRHFLRFLENAMQSPDSALADIEILAAEERRRLLFDFNERAATYPVDKTIQGLFAEQVEIAPHRVALAGPAAVGNPDEVSFTYGELNRQAGRLAELLIDRGVRADTIVGVMVDRGVEMVCAILGILKAGGAYLPIDVSYPPDRKQYMLKDSSAALCLTTRIIFNDLPAGAGEGMKTWPGEAVFLEEILQTGFFRDEKETAAGTLPGQASAGGHTVYIIYTSGTTGRPKGVMIEQKNLISLMRCDPFLFDFNEYDVWTMFHSYCFDFSVWEMYGALLYGGKLVVIAKMEARDAGRYLEILKRQGVTVLNQTPSAFYNLLDLELKERDKALHIKYVIFGGEALNPVRLKEWKARYGETKLINMYGITETTVHVTFKEIGDKEMESSSSNIGRPIPTLHAYIMDRDLKLVPPGASGEMTVGGAGVGRGYLNKPELTAEKFVSGWPGAFL